MSKKSLARFAMAAALAVPAIALAETKVPKAEDLTLSPDSTLPKYVAESVAPKRISADAGVTFSTDYISRGIQLENQGLIAQPYGNLYFTAFEGSGGISKLTLFTGIWSSLHSEDTGASADSFVESWFEFDWDVGFAIDFGKFNFNVMYIEFISPNDAFGTARNLQFKLSYNDSDSKFALAPYAIVFVELDGKAGTGSDEGIYVELGIAPSFPLGNTPDAPKLSVPLWVGLGFSDFYGDADGNDEVFGYAAGGVVISAPIKFLNDAGYGSWTISAGGYMYWFGDGVKDANQAIGTDTEWDCQFSMSIGVAF